MTREELQTYLAEMTEMAIDQRRSVEFICATMWKRFTPDALSLWTTAGVLEHIASWLTPDEPED